MAKKYYDVVYKEGNIGTVLNEFGQPVKEIEIPAERVKSFRLSPKQLLTEDGKFVGTPLVHVHGPTSMLDGAITVEAGVQKMDYVVCFCEHGNIHSAAAAAKAAKESGKQFVLGCEVYSNSLVTGEPSGCHMILLAKNQQGYENLCKVLSKAEQNFYRKPQVSEEILREHAEGLMVSTACLGGELPKHILAGNEDAAEEFIDLLVEIFGKDNVLLEVQRHRLPDEDIANNAIFSLAEEHGLRVVATPDSHYLNKEDAFAHEVLLGIGTHKTLSDPKRFVFEGENYHLPDWRQAEFEELWADHPEVFLGLNHIVRECDFEFDEGHLHMPEFPCPNGQSQDDYFVELVNKGFAKRFSSFESQGKEEEYRARLEYEKSIILEMGFSGYFLIVQDYIAYARSIGGYVGPGRGSAVGSLAAYCLGITDLDPIPYGLLFERERLRSLNPVN